MRLWFGGGNSHNNKESYFWWNVCSVTAKNNDSLSTHKHAHTHKEEIEAIPTLWLCSLCQKLSAWIEFFGRFQSFFFWFYIYSSDSIYISDTSRQPPNITTGTASEGCDDQERRWQLWVSAWVFSRSFFFFSFWMKDVTVKEWWTQPVDDLTVLTTMLFVVVVVVKMWCVVLLFVVVVVFTNWK